MPGRHSRFWTGFTLVLSVVFAALFFPAALARCTLSESLVYTGIGVLVIWIVYFARAAIFSRAFSSRKPPPGSRDIV